MKKNEVILLLRRLSDLMGGSVSLHRSLEILEKQAARKEERNVLASLRRSLEAGKSFSEALAGCGTVFSGIHTGFARAGESSGRLEEALEELARLAEREQETQQKIRAALAYPALLLILALAVSAFLVAYVVPRFQFLFDDFGAILPWPTRLLIGLGVFLERNRWFILCGLAGGATFAVVRRTALSGFLSSLLVKLPWIREWAQGVFLQRWTHMMGSFLRGGFTVSEALTLSRQAFGPGLFSEAIGSAVKEVYEGRSLTESLKSSFLFPPLLREFLAANEESGRLEEAFERLSESYRRETDFAMKMALSFLEPALIVLMGFVLGFVSLAMLLPIFQMSAGLR